jgi:amidohydrolase
MTIELSPVKNGYAATGRAFEAIAKRHPELAAFRRDLHANPEIGFQEHYTSQQVISALKVCGVDDIVTGLGKTGVVAVIKGKTNTQNDMVGLRADMDALPMQEMGDCAWKSKTTGMMHGCGHDGHTAMLLGAVQYLAATRHFDGTAVCIFQPGEEGFAGAKAMMDDGLFERFPVREVYAIHNSPETQAGVIGVTQGPMQAAADKFKIVVSGRGGHGARPHNCIDPVLVAAHIITAVQSIASRNINTADPVVLSICALQAGDLAAFSVIPKDVTMVGTVRTYRPEVQEEVIRRIKLVCESVAAGFGASAEVSYERVYPATINSILQAQFVGDVAAGLVGEDRVLRNMPASMGAEDFSFMLQKIPGAYIRVGQGTEETFKQGWFLHNPRYDFNDDILPLGAALYASLIEKAMPLCT